MAGREQSYAQRFNIGGLGEDRIVACIAVFKELHGDRLLDIGCGDGAVTVQLMHSMGAREAFGTIRLIEDVYRYCDRVPSTVVKDS